jgi:plasmid stability protein
LPANIELIRVLRAGIASIVALDPFSLPAENTLPLSVSRACSSRATLILCRQRREMSNLTIVVDEETLKRARIRALEEGTSVNAVLREFLEGYAGVRRERREAWRRIRELAESSGAGSGGRGLPKREELYDREVLRDRADR